MRNRIIAFVPATLGFVVAVGGLTIAGSSARAEDDCVLKPNTQAAQGGHWYYRTDRVNNRKCWFLRSDDGQVQQAAQAPSADTDDDAPANESASRATASPVRSHIAPQPHRGTDQTPPTHSRYSEQAQAAPAQPSTGLAPSDIPTNIPPFAAAWLWPGGAPSATASGASSTAAPFQPMPDVQAADAPAQGSSFDGPKSVVPVKIQIAQQTPNAQAAAPASQALAQRALSQLQTQRAAGDTPNPPTGGSAMAMLQKAFQRLTAPATPGAEPDHTVALLTSALALVTIAIGIFIAARWSMGADKRNQRPATWDIGEDDIGYEHLNNEEGHEDIGHDAVVDGHVDERETAAQVPHGQDRYRRHASNRPPQHLDDLAAAIAAVQDIRRIKTAAQTRGPQPVQERLYQAYAPAAQAPAPEPAPRTEADTAVSTHAVEDTLRKMLQQLGAKRSDPNAASPIRPGVVRNLAGERPPAAADEFGRHPSRIRRA